MSIKVRKDGQWVDVGGSTGDYIPVPATASVGQTIKVSAIDATGKPTAWEAVDFPEGEGGASGGKWRLLNDITTTEEIAVQQGICLSAADDGTPYNLKEVLFFWICPEAGQSAYVTFRVNGKNRNFPAGVVGFFASGSFYNTGVRTALCEIKALGDTAVLHGVAGINDYGSYGDNVNVVYNYPKSFETITSIEFTAFGSINYPIGLKLTIWGIEV